MSRNYDIGEEAELSITSIRTPQKHPFRWPEGEGYTGLSGVRGFGSPPGGRGLWQEAKASPTSLEVSGAITEFRSRNLETAPLAAPAPVVPPTLDDTPITPEEALRYGVTYAMVITTPYFDRDPLARGALWNQDYRGDVVKPPKYPSRREISLPEFVGKVRTAIGAARYAVGKRPFDVPYPMDVANNRAPDISTDYEPSSLLVRSLVSQILRG